MGEDLRDFAGDYKRNGETTDPYLQNFLCRFADKIESELQKLDEKVDSRFDGLFPSMRDRWRQQDSRIEKNSIAVGEHLKKQDERIEELEKQIKPALFTVTEPTVEEKIDTDKDGKPEGGLKWGDVISYIDRNSEEKILGQFCRIARSPCPSTREKGSVVWAYWQGKETGDIKKDQGFMEKDRVTFEFRPKFPEPKDVQGKLDALEAVFDMFNELSLRDQRAIDGVIKRMKSVHTGS